MMNNSYAYAEVLDVLDHMKPIYIKKIPQSFIEYLKENASLDYKKHITLNKPLDKQNLAPKTLSILAVINLKYWVESEKHKQELLNQYRENGKKEIERLSEQFDSSNIFDKPEENKVTENNFQSMKKAQNLPIEKKSIFRKIIDFFASKIFE